VTAGGLGGLSVAALHLRSTIRRAELHEKRAPARPRRPRTATTPLVVQKTLPSGVSVPTAPWLIAENAKPGTLDWIVNHNQPDHALEGYASHVSATVGDEVAVYVNTTAAAVSVQAYRMGYYNGLGGRLIFQTDAVAAGQQRAPEFVPGVNIVSCPWNPTASFTVDAKWPPGNYLLKLVGNGGEEQFIPLCIRDDASKAAYLLQNSVTTWQAYNRWGGYSLYYGMTANGGANFANRARSVTFDRPYPQDWASGAADWMGNEFPLLYQMESLGLDLTYSTDMDLHANPQLLAKHRCLFSLGHDEYWSAEMRQGAETALASGTNLAFLGANACYRQIRMQATSVGANRQMVCFKDAAEDPMARLNPSLTTVNWNQAPVNSPESLLIGSMYQSVGAMDDMVIGDSNSWLFNGCNLKDGQALPGVVQGEYDRFVPGYPGPANVDVLAHSAVTKQRNWSDVTYYTGPAKTGGVMASGNASFVGRLSNTTAFPSNIVPAAVPGVTDILLRAMENVYGLFGNGPASLSEPSSGSGASFYASAPHSTALPPSTPTA
jgi:hypothetical protein